MFNIHNRLTKDYILEYITQEEIFEFYLRINIQTKHLIKSPLRNNDDTPSFGFRYFGDKLRGKDFNGWFSGDCWDLVGFLHHHKSYIKQDFMKILEQVAKDFRLFEYSDKNYVRKLIDYQKILPPLKIEYNIDVIIREWNKKDLDFWYQFGIKLSNLNYRSVKPALYVYANGELKYDYNSNYNNPCYLYELGNNGTKNELQLYYPLAEKHKKFITLNKYLFGIFKIQPAKILIITKSYKDLMVIEEFIKPLFSVEVVSLRAESIIPSKEEIHYLKSKYKYIFTLFDYDRTGINTAWKCKKQYKLPYLFLTNGKKLSKIDYGAKDFSDYRKYNGETKTIELVKQTIKWFKENYE